MSLIREHAGSRSAFLSSSTMANNIQIRVLAASTGNCYRINLHPNELTVGNIRRQLAAAVPVQDQILLLGPPYKVPKDSTLRSEEVLASLRLGDKEDELNARSNNDVSESQSHNISCNVNVRCPLNTPERSGARRLFLFSKRALSDAAPPPPACVIEPMQLKLPVEPDPSPLVFDHSASHPSPLSQALEVYERRFMLHLCRGRALADGADLRISACRSCVAEQIVMARALRAAVSNLADHRNGATRTRSEFTSDFQSKTGKHAALLDNFEKILSELAGISLHPSLISIARSSGRMMETLVDTVPVDKSKEWANQCRKSHERLQNLFKEVNTAFDQLGSSSAREEEARSDSRAENEIECLFHEVEDDGMRIRDKQAERLDKLTKDHGEVVRVIMDAISGISNQSQNAQAAFITLENMSKSSSDVLPSMESDDTILVHLMTKVASSKNDCMKRAQVRMHQISQAQSNIQRVQSSVSVLRDALTQQCENILHLDRLIELKSSYNDFISEIQRRRAYGNAVTSSSAALMERLASMRSDEVAAREIFLRGSGRHLMPAFFNIFAITLAMPPPLFTPQFPAMVEMDSLPDVGAGVTPVADSEQLSTTAPTTEVSASSSSKNIQLSSSSAPQQADDEHDQQSLIVSADEQSNEIMEETLKEDRMIDEAERKTLAYENALLRQALERMGCKSPTKTYLEGSVAIEKKDMDESVNTSALTAELNEMKSKIASLEKNLSKAKEEESNAKSDLTDLKKSLETNDKISHSSFNVGDVGLFMPTGRAGRAKRTYLAFHSNCPHRYLSADSIEGSPDYILGRIVFQEEMTAGQLGSESNPFGLHTGTRFWMLSVEVLKVP